MIETDVITATIDRSQYKVLVVDDNVATRYSTARVIRAAGFQTAEASSGGDALQMSASGIAAVLLDVHLPDIDGFEVCRRIRQNAATASLPVVHVSAAYIRDEDRVEGLNAGADAYLVHPVEPAVLVATVQALIRARTAEDRVRRSEQHFRAIYTQTQSCIALVDAQGTLVDTNPALQQLLGRSALELAGARVASLAPPDWENHVGRLFSAPAGSERTRDEFPLVDAGGRAVYIDWNLSAASEDGVRVAVGVDVSERHELEQRRREVLEREQAARATAERHSRTKDDFIAVLSHELRTPLNAIIGWVHILRRRGTTPEATKGLDSIERNVKTQARIISDMLDVSRINSGKLRLERALVDPAEVIASSITALSQGIEERKLAVDADLEGAHAPAWIDVARFEQVFWNLMTNAMKFSSVGGRIEVALRRDGDMLELVVRDFGQGMEADFLPQLFDRFSQGDSPENRRHGGLGLGLSIVKHISELHGGNAFASSEGLGKGTTMRVVLPVSAPAAESDSASTEAHPSPPAADAESIAGMDVLLVEDDAEASELLSMVLKERGARVRSASTVDEALAIIRDAPPEAVVSDIGLPGRDGYELVREIRRLEAGTARHMPAIALTAFSRPKDFAKSKEAGFDTHLSKPVRPHELVEALARRIRPR